MACLASQSMTNGAAAKPLPLCGVPTLVLGHRAQQIDPMVGAHIACLDNRFRRLQLPGGPVVLHGG